MSGLNKHLTYTEIQEVCKKINEKFLPDGEAFMEKVDQLLEENEDQTAKGIMLKALPDLLKLVDSETEKIEENVSIKPSCFKGCAYCCYFPIIVTRLEAKLMIEYIKQLPSERSESIVSHLKDYFKNNNTRIEEVCSLDFHEDLQFKDKYISKQLPCPMLNLETNACMAYEVRPIPCRTYLNYGSPDVCADNLIPKEPFSYEFFHGFYIESLNELLQTFFYNGEEVEGVHYPEDMMEYNYLPILLKEELGL